MVSFAPVLTLFYTLAVIAQLPNTRILLLSVLVSIGMLEWGASTRHNFDGSESLNTLGHSQLDEHRTFLETSSEDDAHRVVVWLP
jgi:hypothetical protein